MEKFLNAIEESGWVVEPLWVSHEDGGHLKDECSESHQEGSFHRAGVGRGDSLRIREDIRGDEVMWIGSDPTSIHQTSYLASLECLRVALNRRFFLGLSSFEGHFAIYPQGAFYKPHLDRHAGTRERVVTAILYLNADWQPGDGGELKLWTSPQGRDGPFELVEPRMGTLVCFMAEEFWHEVLPATRQRMSITGWFRERP